MRYPKSKDYPIRAEQRRIARSLGLKLRPSRSKRHKLDAIDGQGRVVSFGGRGYMDFYLWRERKGRAHAEERRRAFKARHQKHRTVRRRDGRYTPAFLADRILW